MNFQPPTSPKEKARGKKRYKRVSNLPLSTEEEVTQGHTSAARFWSRSQFPHRKKAKALTLTATSGAESTATAREGLAEADLVKCMRESAAGS